MYMLHLRREPTTDPISRKLAPGKFRDVVAYRDEKADCPLFRWNGSHKNIPTRRNRYVAANCARYAVRWLPDLIPEVQS